MIDLHARYGDVEIEILGVRFRPMPGVGYNRDYVALYKYLLKASELDQVAKLQAFILYDLWFLSYFVIASADGKHKLNDAKGWFVGCAIEVGDLQETNTLDLWGRGHGKSLLLTIGKTIQYHLLNPEHCTLILSFKKTSAEAFQKSISEIYSNPVMIQLFPMRLYDNPGVESRSWGDEKGICIKRESRSRKENTVESSGLVEGMKTGGRYERLIFDDVVTNDTCTNVEAMDKCFKAFEIALNLGTMSDSDIVNVVGTHFHYLDPLTKIRAMKLPSGESAYKLRKKATTDDGTRTGRPVLVSEDYLERLKLRGDFNTQHLLDPTPYGERELPGDKIQDIDHEFIPRQGVGVFMMVDPAGDGKDGCDWAIMKVLVGPFFDAAGQFCSLQSKRYIIDYFADTLGHTEAINAVCDMYLRGEYVHQLGIEDDRSMTHKFVIELLKQRGRRVSEDMGNFVYLKHRGRNKDARIASAWQPLLFADKWFISKRVPSSLRSKIRLELDQSPHGTKDSIDCGAYVEDMIADFNFQRVREKKKVFVAPKPVCYDTGY